MLDALERLLPETVRSVDEHGMETWLPLAEVQLGDRLRIVAGERIATDGCIVSGCAAIDQQLLTGESRPTTKRAGDAVLGAA